jgi:hypothetical protein
VRDGAPQTLTKLFVFGSESSYNILPTNFDFVCKNYRVHMCTPMSYAGSAPDVYMFLGTNCFYLCGSLCTWSSRITQHAFEI